MMKGVMMSAVLSVANAPATGATGQSEPAHAPVEPGTQVVTSLVNAGKQAFTSPYTVTVKKIEPIPGTNQVRVTFFVTGEDEPAHDFTETGNQAVAAFLNAGMHANVSGAGAATVQKIEAIEGGDDDSDDDSDDSDDSDALAGLVATADAPPMTAARPASAPPAAKPTPPTAPQPTSAMTPEAPAGNVPTLPVAPPIAGERPTTSDSSPVQQPQETTDVKAEDVGEGSGPTQHELPPQIPSQGK